MPNISTHINFIRILINKNFNDFDINFLTLGSIAPNYYVIFNDINKECISHFKKNIKDKCDLNKFNLNIFNKNLNYLEKSFATGYYTHLWLDNYFDENMKKTFFKNCNLKSFKSVILNENIKNYDVKQLLDFITKINIENQAFNDFLPININKSISIFNDFKYKCLNKNFNIKYPIILNEHDYNTFLNNCLDIFLSETINKNIIKTL